VHRPAPIVEHFDRLCRMAEEVDATHVVWLVEFGCRVGFITLEACLDADQAA
jgi:hypothetical protein